MKLRDVPYAEMPNYASFKEMKVKFTTGFKIIVCAYIMDYNALSWVGGIYSIFM